MSNVLRKKSGWFLYKSGTQVKNMRLSKIDHDELQESAAPVNQKKYEIFIQQDKKSDFEKCKQPMNLQKVGQLIEMHDPQAVLLLEGKICHIYHGECNLQSIIRCLEKSYAECKINILPFCCNGNKYDKNVLSFQLNKDFLDSQSTSNIPREKAPNLSNN